MAYSMYIHIPFCKHRCHYCDFITTVGKERLIDPYVDALTKEIREISQRGEKYDLHSIYFGGGTPSLLPVSSFEKIINKIHQRFPVKQDCEISLEANPGTLSLAYLHQLRKLGFNRLSMGVQSTNPFDLARLDRIHTVGDVLDSIYEARKAGFDNLNLDLIFGLPWQNLENWKNVLIQALSLQPEHFSLYSLIVEPGTELFSWHQKGLIALQDQDIEGDMYAFAIKTLADNGYEQYEISNWAKNSPNKDYRSRHNLQYWRNQSYFGLGLGAHGYIDGFRTENTPVLDDYIQRLSSKDHDRGEFPAAAATINLIKVEPATQMKDFMMLGLRLVNEGVTCQRFEENYHLSMASVFNAEIETLQKYGLVAWTDKTKSRLRLTKRGVMVANQAFMQFV